MAYINLKTKWWGRLARDKRAYIREEQREVRGKFEEIREEAAKLKEETNLISRQSAANQLRLDLIFKI
jgi:hypothetical protein